MREFDQHIGIHYHAAGFVHLLPQISPPPPAPPTPHQLPRRKLFHFYCDFPSLSTPAVFNPAVTQRSTIFSRGLGRPELEELDPRQIVIKAKNNERRTKAGVISQAGAIFHPVLFLLLLLLLRVSFENCSRAAREGGKRNSTQKKMRIERATLIGRECNWQGRREREREGGGWEHGRR